MTFHRAAAAIAATLATGSCLAESKKIEDNSFLIEEAYNQEAGVVQHAQALLYDRRTREWLYSFTQEWPVGSQLHQLSYTLPITRTADPTGTGLGDLAINYRYQAIRTETLAMAPRISIVTPTGDWRKARGNGAAGLQVQLPVSVELGEKVVAHVNAGATRTPRARAADGSRASLTSTSFGGSVVYLAAPSFNWMLEVLTSNDESVEDGGGKRRERTTLVSPGFRYAIDHASGAQTVLGMALPQGVNPGPKTRGIFLYLSYEHSFL
jgi:hypothetical protein